jgi:hypothetical protein
VDAGGRGPRRPERGARPPAGPEGPAPAPSSRARPDGLPRLQGLGAPRTAAVALLRRVRLLSCASLAAKGAVCANARDRRWGPRAAVGAPREGRARRPCLPPATAEARDAASAAVPPRRRLLETRTAAGSASSGSSVSTASLTSRRRTLRASTTRTVTARLARETMSRSGSSQRSATITVSPSCGVAGWPSSLRAVRSTSGSCRTVTGAAWASSLLTCARRRSTRVVGPYSTVPVRRRARTTACNARPGAAAPAPSPAVRRGGVAT